MKRIVFLLVFLPSLILAQEKVNGKFANTDFYLIDSLVLADLNASDKTLLKEKLTTFHSSKSDTTKIVALEELIDGMVHPKWEKYQYLQYDLINEALQKKPSATEKKRLKRALGTALNNIGYILNNQGKVEQSMERHLESLKLREEVEHDEGIAVSLLNIGSIHDKQKDYEKALSYYQRALEIHEKIDNSSGVAMCINNMGTVFENQGDLDKSLEYFNEAMEVYEADDDEYGMAIILNNIGTILEQKGQLQASLRHYKRSLELRKKIGMKQSLSTVMNNLGSLHMELGDQGKAKTYLLEAMKLARESGYINQIENSASNLYQFYKKEGNYTKALEMHELFVQMRDSVINQENYRASIEQNARYDYEKKRVADSIRALEAEKIYLANLALEEEKTKKQEIELAAQERQNWILFIGLGLAALFGLLMFQRFRVTKRQKEVIDEQKNEVEQQKDQIEDQHHQLEETHKQISDSIKYAERLQMAILPSSEDLTKNLGNSFVFFQPKDVVSGDFYWMQHIDGNTFIATADCTGHGVPGAMVSVVCSNALNRAVKEFRLTKPCEILDKTRELVIETFSRSGENVKDGMDISLIRKDQDKIVFAGAYNPLWLVRKTELLTESEKNSRGNVVGEDVSLLEFKSNKQPIGLFDYMTPFQESEIPIQSGDTIYLFTDGFADQFGGEKGKKFKYKPFKNYLLGLNNLNMSQQKDALTAEFRNWKGDLEQLDDVCVIGIRFN